MLLFCSFIFTLVMMFPPQALCTSRNTQSWNQGSGALNSTQQIRQLFHKTAVHQDGANLHPDETAGLQKDGSFRAMGH